MALSHLASALKSIAWEKAVDAFLANGHATAGIDTSCARIALWSRQFENVDKGNSALTFVRALQTASQHVAATASLALYRSSAASIRSVVENGLYYSYFRCHPAELASLVRDSSYHLSRSDLIAYHKQHTPHFKLLQEKLGFLSRLDSWYSSISAVVHGQIPGTWVEHSSLAEIKYNPATLSIVTQSFVEAEELVHHLFLLTIGRDLWDGFSAGAKKSLLAGLSAEVKTALALDKA